MRRAVILLFPLAVLPALASADEAPACNTWELEYTLSGQLRLSDTAMGAADGLHAVGPGKLVMHFDNVGGQPGGNAKLMTYELTQQFTVDAHVLGLGTTVLSNSTIRTTPNLCGVSATGALGSDHIVRWATPWNGVHADGQVNCSGSMCGRLGAPPSGPSAIHTQAHPAAFKPFEFAQDMKAFRMDYVVTAKSASPSQTTSLSLLGREARRSCVNVPQCP
jgi:hypothetical protein